MKRNARLLMAALLAASVALVLALHVLAAPRLLALRAPSGLAGNDPAVQPAGPEDEADILAATNCRYGVGFVPDYVKSLEWVPTLDAGWYINFAAQDWGANIHSASFAPVVRVRQDRANGSRLPTYTFNPPLVYTYRDESGIVRDGLGRLILRNLGHYWIVGNEPDVNNNVQDNTMPDVYARAYHDAYQFIKMVDPTAKVANAGLSMMTPGRLQYLTIVWNTYHNLYGQDMPVDIWNMHLYILEERLPGNGPNEYGDGKIALGTDPNIAKLSSAGQAKFCPAPGAPDIPASDPHPEVYCKTEHDSVRIFREQVTAMRQWMKERGQQNKPLIISEYGLLYSYVIDPGGTCNVMDEHGNCYKPERVTKFLRDTVKFMEETKDATLGYPADENRLVQQWLWYSIVTDPGLSGGASNLIRNDFEKFPLGDPAALTIMGQAYQQEATSRVGQSNLVGGVASNVVGLINRNTGKGSAILTASFRNGGTLSVIKPITITFYSDQALTKPIGSAMFEPASRGSVTGCTWGGRNSDKVSVLWSGLSTGTHRYWAKIDAGNTIPESNESDNVTPAGTVTILENGLFVPVVTR